jgi:hypothetical protein
MALIKIYFALYIAQSIQLSKFVLASFRWLTRLSGFRLFVARFQISA